MPISIIVKRATNIGASALDLVGLEAQITALLQQGGINTRPISVSTCSRGGNNRIHRVETEKGAFAVKEYFQHPRDLRDRLAAETAFLKYANEASPGVTAQFFASDSNIGMALFEFISGCPFRPGDITAAHVDAAASFFCALNEPTHQAKASLPIASEATFSIAEQVRVIEARVAQLLLLKPQSDFDAEALALARQLRDFWNDIADKIRRTATQESLGTGESDRCVSPSDFGFHNAILADGGHVRFVDFEYAGWDDVAKTAGDFFAQLAVPVPTEYFDRFLQRIAEMLPDPALAARRAHLLRPAYQIKWCCIALNVFLPVHLARRRFAHPTLDEDALKAAQIEKANYLLARITGATQ